MKRNDFLEKIKKYDGKLEMWQLETNELCHGDYILGCYFDNDSKVWKVYINNERGRQRIKLSTKDEDEAFDKLFSMVQFQAEMIRRSQS
ncbi:hypothetical protein EDD66_103135 [Mobilisporobacter senegalensis]|uniref:Uncharacterized protein n=1 Tax=Mobilisporobacter senegalensis TaxID=1329262 RepID=A0A3N1XRA8_9FIRM|nr:hypothetical protein [Mobilisporobacter senegalensis]ROR29200.1 hypothetical protein EDD66_103135 [Mobilisporobacter senegalensis]